MNLPLAHSLALSLHSTHPLSCRFLAGLNESFPTRCGRSCGMPFLLENRPKTVKKISRGCAPDPPGLPISGRAPRQSGPPAKAQRAGLGIWASDSRSVCGLTILYCLHLDIITRTFKCIKILFLIVQSRLNKTTNGTYYNTQTARKALDGQQRERERESQLMAVATATLVENRSFRARPGAPGAP